jgi:hypothetical protein
MAKKKKTKAPARRRRSRIGATGSDMIQTIAGLAVGVIGGRMLSNGIGTKISPTIVEGAKTIGGIYLPSKIGGGSALIKAVGLGLAASGVQNLAVNMGVIRGIDETIDYSMPISGYPEAIAGIENGIAGFDDAVI